MFFTALGPETEEKIKIQKVIWALAFSGHEKFNDSFSKFFV